MDLRENSRGKLRGKLANFGLKMVQNWSKYGPKMVQKWFENGPKVDHQVDLSAKGDTPEKKTTLRGNFSHMVRPPPTPQYGNAHVTKKF